MKLPFTPKKVTHLLAVRALGQLGVDAVRLRLGDISPFNGDDFHLGKVDATAVKILRAKHLSGRCVEGEGKFGVAVYLQIPGDIGAVAIVDVPQGAIIDFTAHIAPLIAANGSRLSI